MQKNIKNLLKPLYFFPGMYYISIYTIRTFNPT